MYIREDRFTHKGRELAFFTVIKEVKEEIAEIKKPSVPSKMDVKVWERIRELRFKDSLTQEEIVILAELQSQLKISTNNRLSHK